MLAACGRQCRNVAAAWEQAGSHSRATRTPALRLVPAPATPRQAAPLHLASGALFLHSWPRSQPQMLSDALAYRSVARRPTHTRGRGGENRGKLFGVAAGSLPVPDTEALATYIIIKSHSPYLGRDYWVLVSSQPSIASSRRAEAQHWRACGASAGRGGGQGEGKGRTVLGGECGAWRAWDSGRAVGRCSV